MQYTIASMLVALALIAGTILGANATYQFGSNPVLTLKNAQAQENEVVMAPLVNLSFPNQEMIGPTPEAGIKQGGGEGVEEATEIYGPNDTLPQNGMIVPTFEETKSVPLPLPSDKPELTPIEPPAQSGGLDVVAPKPFIQGPAAPVEECVSQEIAIITEANKTAEEVITVIEENVMNTATVEEVTNAVENVSETVEANVNGTANVTETTEVVEEVVEVVEETPEVNQVTEAKGGLIALLTELVNANKVNPNLMEHEKAIQEQYLEQAKQQLSLAFS